MREQDLVWEFWLRMMAEGITADSVTWGEGAVVQPRMKASRCAPGTPLFHVALLATVSENQIFVQIERQSEQ